MAFEVNLAVKGDCTIAMWFTDHFAEVRSARFPPESCRFTG